MTDFFNIWNPHQPNETTLILDITPAEAALVCGGSRAFVSACLNACGILANFSSWTVRTARQSYYSDYLQSPDWRARWDIVWILEVTLSSEFDLRNPVKVFPYKTDVLDESAEGYDEPEMDFGLGLLLGSFNCSEKLELEIRESIQKWKAETGVTAEFSLVRIPQEGGRLLVRGLIDCLKFPGDISDLECLLAKWRRIGGLTNWQDVLKRIMTD